ncbi:hypothetical protein TIFTF001_012510 [Ficus carica]|uniref:Uncharacterized protein n=1 Tax=Ficus carica TaxID=3494 RepID=A0AA88ACF1_FICCA|nr:hypothetical protein TIFTF001_012510 [Ficus carica]
MENDIPGVEGQIYNERNLGVNDRNWTMSELLAGSRCVIAHEINFPYLASADMSVVYFCCCLGIVPGSKLHVSESSCVLRWHI